MKLAFWGCLIIIFYIFGGYPILLQFLSFVKTKPINKKNILPKVTIIIPAHNEEKVIEKKILNTFKLNYPPEQLEVICASDGSDDRTVEIALSLLSEDNIISIPGRQGKTNIINIATAKASGEIIVYTDANITLDKQAIRNLVRNFADPEVGCVAGQLTHINTAESHTAASVGLYWRYEEFIKKKESETGSIMGADGGIFAIRRELFKPLPLFIIDDYATSIGILTKGYRVIFEPEAKAFERATIKTREELRRKVRIATRSVSATLYLGQAILELSAMNLMKFTSHRILRYIACYLLLGALFTNLVIVLQNGNIFYRWLIGMQALFYCSGLVGITLMDRKPSGMLKLVRLITYFLSANMAACLGATRAVLGRRVKFWESPKSAR